MKFQTILLTFFGFMIVLGVIVFSIPPAPKNTALAGAKGNVTIWGTFPDSPDLKGMINRFNETYKESFSISYYYHDSKAFDNDIVEALASGKGPDILLLPDDLILRHSDKIAAIPYTSMSSDQFSSLFVQAAEIYLRQNGIVALPFAIDPLVMYWNRDLYSNASITQPPKYWDEFLTLSPKLTKRDQRTQELLQSALPFGEYSNVVHAKDILATLFLQVGNPIVSMASGQPQSTIADKGGAGAPVVGQDTISALRFFMDFSDPQKSNYTWSRAKGNSRDEFIAGNLATYFDFASAKQTLILKNPHLNFSVAALPLPRETKVELTFAKVYGLAVMKSSGNQQTAFTAVQRLLLDPTPAKEFAAAFGLPPVRRDMLSEHPSDEGLAIFYTAAIRARTWLDPKPEVSDKAFQNMVESISSGRSDYAQAIAKLDSEISTACAKYY
jgi:ABC-type glycerol-3-phosphate transport system substrate-binding protein